MSPYLFWILKNVSCKKLLSGFSDHQRGIIVSNVYSDVRNGKLTVANYASSNETKCEINPKFILKDAKQAF